MGGDTWVTNARVSTRTSSSVRGDQCQISGTVTSSSPFPSSYMTLRGSLQISLHKSVWKRSPASAYLLRNWKSCALLCTKSHLPSKSAPSDADWVMSITFSSAPNYIMVRPEWTFLLNLIDCFIRSTLAFIFRVNPFLTTVKWCLKYSFDWIPYPLSLIYHSVLLLTAERVSLNRVRETGMFPGYASVYCTLIGSLMH